MLELHINKCKNLGPVIYAKSNPSHGFTKSVGFRDSLSKRKKNYGCSWRGLEKYKWYSQKSLRPSRFKVSDSISDLLSLEGFLQILMTCCWQTRQLGPFFLQVSTSSLDLVGSIMLTLNELVSGRHNGIYQLFMRCDLRVHCLLFLNKILNSCR